MNRNLHISNLKSKTLKSFKKIKFEKLFTNKISSLSAPMRCCFFLPKTFKYNAVLAHFRCNYIINYIKTHLEARKVRHKKPLVMSEMLNIEEN